MFEKRKAKSVQTYKDSVIESDHRVSLCHALDAILGDAKSRRMIAKLDGLQVALNAQLPRLQYTGESRRVWLAGFIGAHVPDLYMTSGGAETIIMYDVGQLRIEFAHVVWSSSASAFEYTYPYIYVLSSRAD